MTAAERRRLAARLGWDYDGGALGALERALEAAFGVEVPAAACGGEAFPRRARTRTLWELARRTMGEDEAAAVFREAAEAVKACWYLDPAEALDALAAACGLAQKGGAA